MEMEKERKKEWDATPRVTELQVHSPQVTANQPYHRDHGRVAKEAEDSWPVGLVVLGFLRVVTIVI
jgi:hypothetical protein